MNENNINIQKWKDFEREDLKIIPTMIKNGWQVSFSDKDKLYGRVTPEFIPECSVNFIKGDKWTWKIKNGWQTADLINGSYCNYLLFDNIEEVILHYQNPIFSSKSKNDFAINYVESLPDNEKLESFIKFIIKNSHIAGQELHEGRINYLIESLNKLDKLIGDNLSLYHLKVIVQDALKQIK